MGAKQEVELQKQTAVPESWSSKDHRVSGEHVIDRIYSAAFIDCDKSQVLTSIHRKRQYIEQEDNADNATVGLERVVNTYLLLEYIDPDGAHWLTKWFSVHLHNLQRHPQHAMSIAHTYIHTPTHTNQPNTSTTCYFSRI